jgi:hypothetical protein
MACIFSETVVSQCPCMAIMCKNESMDGVCVKIMAGEVKCKYLTAKCQNFIPEHKVSGRHTIITLLVSEQHLVTHIKNTLGFGFPLNSRLWFPVNHRR